MDSPAARLCLLALLGALTAPDVASAQVRRPLPVVQRVEPTSGPPGVEVTLHGRFFDPAQTLWLGETQLTVVGRFPNRWTVSIPDGARSGTIEVRTERGNTRGPRFRVSAAAPPPTVSGLSPSSGAVGEEVVIRGERFSTRPSENHVHLGETPVVVRSATSTELHVLVPAGAATAAFRVRVTGSGEASSELFTVAAGTAITSFAPAVGPAGTRVTLTGTGFSRSRRSVTVTLGEVRARVIRASETELTVEVPRRGAVSGRWLVEIRRGGRAFSATEFEVRAPPTIASMSPAFGAAGTRVTLEGAHFGTDVRRVAATIGEAALRVRDLSNERVVLEIPEGAASGRIELTIGGLGPARTAEFRVTSAVAVSGFAPTAGPAGTQVTITGSGFSTDRSHNTVTMGSAAVEVVRASATELVVRVPDSASGALNVAVANAGQARTAAPFVVTHPPGITGFTPVGGPPGTEVTIRGAGFGRLRGLLEVRFGQTRGEVQRATDGEIVVTVPRGATSGPIRVTRRLEGSATSAERFSVHGE